MKKTKNITEIKEKLPTVSVPEAGRMLGNAGKNTSYASVKRGEIPVIRIGKKMRVSRAWIERKLAGLDA